MTGDREQGGIGAKLQTSLGCIDGDLSEKWRIFDYMKCKEI